MMETNRLTRTSLLVALVFVVCFAGQTAQASTTFVVGTCSTAGAQFPTIQAAVNAVTSGVATTIDVCPGTYAEQVMITQNKLTLTGLKHGTSEASVVVPPSGGMVQNGVDIFGNPVAAQIFVKSASGVTIKNMIVDGTGNDLSPCVPVTFEGVYFQNSSGTIGSNVVRNQYQTDYADWGACQNGLAINVESLTSANSVTVDANSVRAYQKNGITATGAATGPGAPGPVMTITANYVVGLGTTAMNWLTPGAAENGIQVGFGASGTITENFVDDNIWAPANIDDTGDAASGILIYASPGFSLKDNRVNSAQFGILAVTDLVDGYGTADNTSIVQNNVVGTQVFDGIDVCSNSNMVTENDIYGSAESAIHLDDTCGGTGNSNTVTLNLINEACAGVLLGTGTGNTVSSNNKFNNLQYTTLAGDSCSLPQVAGEKASKKRQTLRPSPYMPMKR